MSRSNWADRLEVSTTASRGSWRRNACLSMSGILHAVLREIRVPRVVLHPCWFDSQTRVEYHPWHPAMYGERSVPPGENLGGAHRVLFVPARRSSSQCLEALSKPVPRAARPCFDCWRKNGRAACGTGGEKIQ